MTPDPREPGKRTRAYDVAKHLSIREAVTVCKLAREAVEQFDVLRAFPDTASVNSFTYSMDKLRAILIPGASA